jgi:hypothetical protein
LLSTGASATEEQKRKKKMFSHSSEDVKRSGTPSIARLGFPNA